MPADRRPNTYQKPKHGGNAKAGPGPSSMSASGSGSASAARGKHVRPIEDRDAQGVPGVSKLKAQIRQTKRLLAKENLEPGLRVNTQRRLTSLEADLEVASRRDVEKRNGSKYHMVKFFERRKLERIIRRAQRNLASNSGAQAELDDARAMLNYVIHYPNAEKYIALFSDAQESKKKSDASLTLPPLFTNTTTLDKPARARLDRLLEIRRLMQDGTMSREPEVEKSGPRQGLLSTKVVKRSSIKAAVEKEEDDFFEDDE